MEGFFAESVHAYAERTIRLRAYRVRATGGTPVAHRPRRTAVGEPAGNGTLRLLPGRPAVRAAPAGAAMSACPDGAGASPCRCWRSWSCGPARLRPRSSRARPATPLGPEIQRQRELERDSAVNLSLAKKSIQDDAFYSAKVALNVWKSSAIDAGNFDQKALRRSAQAALRKIPARQPALHRHLDRPARRARRQPLPEDLPPARDRDRQLRPQALRGAADAGGGNQEEREVSTRRIMAASG